jgi:hypothetical protein
VSKPLGILSEQFALGHKIIIQEPPGLELLPKFQMFFAVE